MSHAQAFSEAPEGAKIHACPPDPACGYCKGSVPDAERLDWSFLGAVYCLSLQSRDDRMHEAAEEFHRVGLCQQVLFYRGVKHPEKGIIGSWESHRAALRAGLERGSERTLVFEDDVHFTRVPTPASLDAIRRALDGLPDDWTIFHLGHWPLWAYFFRRNVLKTSSACAHAYVASRRLAEWLVAHPWGTPGVEKRSVPFVSKALDSAYAAMPGTYALFPMIAIQRVSPSDNFKRNRPIRKLRHLLTRTRYREILISRLMRPSEVVAVVLSPLHWMRHRVRRAPGTATG